MFEVVYCVLVFVRGFASAGVDIFIPYLRRGISENPFLVLTL